MQNKGKYGCSKLPENYRVNDGKASSWHSPFIKWHLTNADDKTYDEIKPICDNVFSMWQEAFDLIEPFGEVIKLECTDNFDEADILLTFCNPMHKNQKVRTRDGRVSVVECVWDFEKGSGVLAHAFSLFSSYNKGQVHINKREDFHVLSLQEILLHELGHVFHLSHSERTDALMYYAYRGDFLRITEDDILGLQEVWSDAKRAIAKKNNIKVIEKAVYKKKSIKWGWVCLIILVAIVITILYIK